MICNQQLVINNNVQILSKVCVHMYYFKKAIGYRRTYCSLEKEAMSNSWPYIKLYDEILIDFNSKLRTCESNDRYVQCSSQGNAVIDILL